MGNDEQEDEVNLVLPYVVSEPISSPQRNKFGKFSRLTEAERLRNDDIKNLIQYNTIQLQIYIVH